MSNPNKIGELSAFYYQITAEGTPYDLSQDDVDILHTDQNWSKLCLVSADNGAEKDSIEINDQCVNGIKQFVMGNTDYTLTINLNELRIAFADRPAWDAVLDEGKEIAILLLDDLKEELEVTGTVGRYYCQSETTAQAMQATNAQTRVFKPAIDDTIATVRRIYGTAPPA